MSFLIHLNFTPLRRYNIQITFHYITWICLYFLKSLLTAIPHMYCLLGYRKNTFTIHYIFTFLAHIIFSHFSLHSVHVWLLSFSQKSLFRILNTWYGTWHLLNFLFVRYSKQSLFNFLLWNKLFSHPLQLLVNSLLVSISRIYVSSTPYNFVVTF